MTPKVLVIAITRTYAVEGEKGHEWVTEWGQDPKTLSIPKEPQEGFNALFLLVQGVKQFKKKELIDNCVAGLQIWKDSNPDIFAGVEKVLLFVHGKETPEKTTKEIAEEMLGDLCRELEEELSIKIEVANGFAGIYSSSDTDRDLAFLGLIQKISECNIEQSQKDQLEEIIYKEIRAILLLANLFMSFKDSLLRIQLNVHTIKNAGSKKEMEELKKEAAKDLFEIKKEWIKFEGFLEKRGKAAMQDPDKPIEESILEDAGSLRGFLKGTPEYRKGQTGSHELWDLMIETLGRLYEEKEIDDEKSTELSDYVQTLNLEDWKKELKELSEKSDRVIEAVQNQT